MSGTLSLKASPSGSSSGPTPVMDAARQKRRASERAGRFAIQDAGKASLPHRAGTNL
jgi:hypothetical protein